MNWIPGDEINPWDKEKVVWKQYPDSTEHIMHDMPEPWGKSFQLNWFVNADHVGNKVMYRSHTGILIYGNMAPILWYSKNKYSRNIAMEIIESLLAL